MYYQTIILYFRFEIVGTYKMTNTRIQSILQKINRNIYNIFVLIYQLSLLSFFEYNWRPQLFAKSTMTVTYIITGLQFREKDLENWSFSYF